jgi:WAS family protein
MYYYILQKHNRSAGRTQSQVKVKHLKRKVYSGKDKELETSSAKYSIEDSAIGTNEIKPSEQNGSLPSPPQSLSPDGTIMYDERRATSASRRGTASKMPRPATKPPPPPPVPSQVEDLPLPQPPPDFPPPLSLDVPPPPPPPPDQNIFAPPPPPLPTIQPNHLPPSITPNEPAQPPEPKPIDARTDLLEAIRTGMKLRKVQEESEKKEQQTVGMDVASILQRRIAVEYSDTESETGSEWDDDDEEWQDDDDE